MIILPFWKESLRREIGKLLRINGPLYRAAVACLCLTLSTHNSQFVCFSKTFRRLQRLGHNSSTNNAIEHFKHKQTIRKHNLHDLARGRIEHIDII